MIDLERPNADFHILSKTSLRTSGILSMNVPEHHANAV